MRWNCKIRASDSMQIKCCLYEEHVIQNTSAISIALKKSKNKKKINRSDLKAMNVSTPDLIYLSIQQRNDSNLDD